MKTYIFLFIVVAWLLVGCKVTSVNVAVKPVPATFSNRVDTASNMSNIPLRDLFNDPLLDELIVTAIRENLDLKMAVQRIEQAHAGLRIGRGGLLPSITGIGSVGQKRFGDYTMDAIGNHDTNYSEHITEDQHLPVHMPDYYIGLQSTWEIDVWTKLRSLKRAAYYRYLASQQGKRWLTTTLVASVASMYYELLALDNEMAIVNKNIILQERAFEVIEVQKAAGRATALGVAQVKAQLLDTRSIQAQLQQEITITETSMNLLLGQYGQSIKRGKPIMELVLPPLLGTGIPVEMIARRADIIQAEQELVASRADVKAARAAFFPSVMLNSSVGLQSFQAAYFFEPGALAYSVLGGLTAPLFNKNKIRADFQAANAGSLQAFYSYQKTCISAYQEVLNNLAQIDNYGRVATLKTEEVETLNKAVAASYELFAASYATYLEVITAQRSVLQAELNLANARKKQFQAIVGLYRSLGGGWD